MPATRFPFFLRKSSGFTLIEVMIAIVIVGVLTAVAMPSYRTYSRQGKLPEAHAALATQRLKMEQSYQDNQTYVGACAAGTSTELPPSTANFTFACSNLTATTYTVAATGRNAMNGFVFNINQNNVRSTSGAPSGWSTSTTCWISTPSGC